ncbi:LytTR family DNA-binding domain-containing protein [Simiduia curdlanivorans]|uniref:LytR/AlgR family response regulator transcription factor n=1 Tax=Simiduia curdlanivorans TaxID=1492769 RepID=A0ABV8V239_9GAMM|nr:LytTR family DNA-binding domain-containing protein [Simiduia curdlanivorans]MDN3638133.1 LytTR family DNA-binding domain-containing protein [Simiduia curdlanivorans]
MDLLIVDDEPLARARLRRLVEELADFDVVAEAADGEAAMAAIEEHDPAVVLLDVRMPGEDGIAVAKRIAQLDHAPAIIFCTAYDEYALDAFGTDAVGYLLKPVQQADLQKVLDKAVKLNRLQLEAMKEAPVKHSGRQHISAKTRRGVELISLVDVRFFIADQKYVTVHHLAGETLIDDTLKDLEEEFSGRFIRVHRNSLVAIEYIEAMERSTDGHFKLRLTGLDTKPVVSRRHVPQLKELLSKL